MRIFRIAVLFMTLFVVFPASAQEEHEPARSAEEAHGGHSISVGAILGNTQFQVTALTFLILVGVLYRGYKAIGAPALQARRREIERALTEAQAKKEEAEAMREEYKGRLARMEVELAKIREQMVKAGEAERDRMLEEADSKAASMRRDAEFQIAQKMKTLREELAAEAVTRAVSAAEEVIRGATTRADQTRLADAYLEELGGASDTSVASSPRRAHP